MKIYLILAIPLICALLSLLFKNRKVDGILTFIGTAIVFFLSLLMAEEVIKKGSVTILHSWISCDGLSALILLLISFIGVTASLFSIGYLREEEGHLEKSAGSRYYLHFNLFLFSMLAVPVLSELALVWIAIEFTTLFSVLLVRFENTKQALEAAWKYIVLTMMGASFALIGFFLLEGGIQAAGGGAFTWNELLKLSPAVSPPLLKLAFIFILIGFGTKVGLFPLHTWLPDAHSQAPSPVCALLSGIETTVVLYVILRLFPVLQGDPSFHAMDFTLFLGLLSAGAGAFLIFQVRDYKRLFAFSTIEQMGIILTASSLGSTTGMAGAVFQIFTHALTKSFCFYAAGSVLLVTGTREISSIKGLLRQSPYAGTSLLLGGLALSGFPPFALFMSEFFILKTWIFAGYDWISGVLAVFLLAAFIGILFHINRMFFGKSENSKKSSLPFPCKLSLLISAIPVLLFGIWIPPFLHHLLHAASLSLVRVTVVKTHPLSLMCQMHSFYRRGER